MRRSSGLCARIAMGALLGSDVAAGSELNPWQVTRSAINGQRARSFYEPAVPPLRAAEAFYLATAGGARALGKTDVMGTLTVGQEADLLVVDLETLLPYGADGGALAQMSAEDVLELCIYRGGPEATRETYVRGRCVYRKPEAASRV
ncbi:MAG: amidohydrolase family protein [Chthoniobacterales bacterium]